MRTTKYSFAQPTATAPAAAQTPTVNKPSFESSVIRKLSDEIVRPVSKPTPQPQTEPKPTPEAEKPTTETTNPQPATEPTKGTANLGEDFEKFKDKFREDGTKAIEDPKRAAATTLKFINFIRTIGYPFLMKWAIFEPAEKAELDKILAKVFEAQKASTQTNRAPFDKVISELSLFELNVYNKWVGFEAHKKNIAWTETEINFLVEVGHLKMQEVAFIKWLMQNEFAMAILFIEGRRIVPVVTARMGLGFIDVPMFGF